MCMVNCGHIIPKADKCVTWAPRQFSRDVINLRFQLPCGILNGLITHMGAHNILFPTLNRFQLKAQKFRIVLLEVDYLGFFLRDLKFQPLCQP